MRMYCLHVSAMMSACFCMEDLQQHGLSRAFQFTVVTLMSVILSPWIVERVVYVLNRMLSIYRCDGRDMWGFQIETAGPPWSNLFCSPISISVHSFKT